MKEGKGTMKYLIQISIIMTITFLGEILNKLIPLPIPASIYGLLILLVCLMTGIIKIEQVKPASNFLLDIMPVMFIPAAVGMIDIWNDISGLMLPLMLITFPATIFVMVAAGKTADFVLMKDRVKNK